MDDDMMAPVTRAMLMKSVLGPYVAQYCAHLREGRYAANTRRVYLCCVAHFASWITTERLGPDRADEEAGSRFVACHLPRCTCPAPVRRVPHEIKAALTHLYRVLRACGALATAPGLGDPLRSELAAFDRYMDTDRGLAANTRDQRARIVSQFLTGRFRTGPLVLTDVTAVDLRRFVLEGGERRSAGTIGVMAGALRCYLRFRALSGDPIGALAESIPTAAHWRLAALPEVLSQAEIDQLLGSFGKPFPSAKRAYAMVRCLADLGLRAGEIARLRLEDVDWGAGTLRLVQGKSRRTDVLPLPPETGRAIADYLRAERPRTANRAVFVRHVAPYDEPIGTGVVQRAVRAAYRRCGWTRTRVHTLRHSVASRLLRQGTPLKEIADLLRHRSLDTSAIYAKVDVGRLAAVVLPWPGRGVMIAAPSMLSLVLDYLDERRRLGFALTIPGTQLLAFARFADRSGHRGPLTSALITGWAQGEATRATPITWARRLALVRPFARYCARTEAGTQIPDADVFGRQHRRLTPHIYADAEIADLLAAARRLPPTGTLRPATYEAFFGLIAATGLRLSEALHLRRADVDIDRDVLTVRQTKFCKSRLVPLHPTTTEALTGYLMTRQRHLPSAMDPPLFVSQSGAGLVKRTVHCVFAGLRAELGWVARGTHPAPRIHDLRHTFICRRVMLWHELGTDIDNAMLALSTYVGHAKVSDTYWYLTGVPELMAVAGRRFEPFAVDPGEARHG